MDDSDKLQARRIADKYIGRDGGEPVHELTDPRIEAIRDVASFVAWHEPTDIMGGVTAREAFEALCTLIGYNGERAERLYKIVRGEV